MRKLSDDAMDAKFNKYIRPGVFIFTVVVFVCFAVIDGNFLGIQIKLPYITALASFIEIMIVWYFTSRGIEKITKSIYGNKDQERKDGE